MTTIVPFGKYKGQPIEVLSQDEAYLDWLTAQDWFRTKYQNLYTVIINNFSAPTETPEHNVMQAKFLDEEYCKNFILITNSCNKLITDELFDGRMENSGMDVRIDYIMEHYKTGKNDRVISAFIEIKPTLGDDYPAVLRQIISSSAYKAWRNDQYGGDLDAKRPAGWIDADGMGFYLFIGSFQGSISKEQLIAYFRTSHIQVVFESDIEGKSVIWSETEDNWTIVTNATN